MAQIFPWAERELKALRLRMAADHQASDFALEKFLELLKDMHKVLAQDPASFIYSCAPFNSPLFRQFAADASAMLEESENNARLALQNLPVNVAQTFEGAIQLLVKKQVEFENRVDLRLNQHDLRFDALSESLARIQGAVEYLQLTVEPPKKRRKLNAKTSCMPA